MSTVLSPISANPAATSLFSLAELVLPDTGDAAAFDDEWRRETSRFRPQRGLEYRRHEGSSRRAEGTRLAIQGPEDSPSRQSRRYDW